MVRARFVLVLGALMASAAPSPSGIQAQAPRRAATAEDTASGVLAVQTIALKHLDVKDAARLIAPYLQSARSGAFEAGSELGVITVRGTNRELQEAVALLTEYDRAPRTVRLRFQIIEPIEEATRDSRISDVSSALRELFSAPGYRLLAQSVVTSDEYRRFHVSISTGLDALYVSGRAQRSEHTSDGVRLQVELHQSANDASNAALAPLFSGSLTATFGQVVVMGSAAPKIWTSQTTTSRRTLILTVQPDWTDKP
jgi:hypothetical protein